VWEEETVVGVGQKGRVHRSTMTPIVARWEMLAGQDNTRHIFLKKIRPSYHDELYRGAMTLLGDQADETHMISYNF
jgi:hypothetical protein